MKQFTPAVTNLINNLGIEPVNILEVQWVTNGPFLKYGDKEADDNIEGVILTLSDLEAVIKLDSEGQSQGISVTLDDTSGAIKAIMDVNDIHGKRVKLTQWLEGLPLNEAFQIYEGEITSPIVWSEGDRTVSFSVITKLADKEVGFSPEEADFPFLPDNLVGQPWPMAFGIVQNVPATRLQEVPISQSGQDLGLFDPTLQPKLDSIEQTRTELTEWQLIYIYALLQLELTADFGSTQQERDAAAALIPTVQGYLSQIATQLAKVNTDFDSLNTVREEQIAASNSSIELLNVAGFPSGPITLLIGNIELSGTLTGNTFNIDAIVDNNFTNIFDTPYGFTYIEAGTTITLKSDNTILYVVNIIESTVLSVQVYKETDNGPRLVTIPSSWYTVRQEISGPYNFTLLEFSQSISSRDKTLSDDIYVTMNSSVGPNTVDIMIWLIETYTDLTYNIPSFVDVRAKVENYPSHFAMLERRNVFAILEEIAMQARCAIWVNNNIFYIKYLSEEQPSVSTITESDIDAGSLILEVTQTEELVTKMIATWSDNYAEDDKNKIILRHNVAKYGTREREIDFYIYNIPELVVKSATFWMIRFSNVWKNISFDTYVNNLAIETFDTITLALSNNHISNSDVKCMVTGVIYNTSDHLLNLTCWVPVKFGTMDAFIFSWPSDILPSYTYPTKDDRALDYAGGAGPGVTVDGTFASGQDFTGGSVNYNDRRDYGDKRPSDIDDKKPTPNFKGVNYSPGTEPVWDYGYNKYPVDFVDPPTPDETEFQGAVFPGFIVNAAEETNTYNVDVFTTGVLNNPVRKIVKQLQLADIEEIPTGTWVLVAKNTASDPEVSVNDDGFEWTMQVPVWL